MPEYKEPTTEEMIKAIYNNVCRKTCKCGKKFIDKGGWGECFDCSQSNKNENSKPVETEELLNF